MTTLANREALAKGNEAGRRSRKAKKEANRAEAAKILDRMKRTGKSLTNEQITDAVGVDPSWLYSAIHQDLKKRADAIRDDIDKERRRPHSTPDRTELELALQAENDSLHQEVQALRRRLRLKDEALAKSRSQQLSQEESVIDLTTAQTIKDSNDQLAAERDAARDAQVAGRANLAGKKLELARAKREHGHTKDALAKARREIKRLQSHAAQ